MKLTLEEAQERLVKITGVKFCDIFSGDDLSYIIKNKGKTGQILEVALGMRNSSDNLDFVNGELKTNKCDKNGKPLETIFITQISSVIDEILQERPFEETHLYEKIKNILYVPVCKVGDPKEWKFLPSRHINLNREEYKWLEKIWRDDYYSICKQLKNHIEHDEDGFIHTSNGRHIQVRSKDSKPYNPIYSNVYGKNVSNKNHAYYFQKSFINDIRGL